MVLIGRSNCQEQRVHPVSERHIGLSLPCISSGPAPTKVLQNPRMFILGQQESEDGYLPVEILLHTLRRT